MAILAGIVAQVLEDNFGQIGPFQGAIALTALALVLVLNWEENYGEESTEQQGESASLTKQLMDGWSTTVSDSRVWRIGLTQALSEGAMYTVSSRLFCSNLQPPDIGAHIDLVLVCLYVGPYIAVARARRRRPYRLRLLVAHDGHYHGRDSVSYSLFLV